MKKHDTLLSLLFCGFLAVMAVGSFLPKSDFSAMEKRYLAKAPDFSTDPLLDGSWGKQADAYLIDHIPERNLFVGLNAYCEKLLGRQKLSDIWELDGKLVRSPVDPASGAMERNVDALNRFAKGLEVPVSLALVPSCGFALGAPEYAEEPLLDAIYNRSELENLDLRECYRGRPELFYSTDHHWTSAGAFEAYKVMMNTWGITPEMEYTVERFDHFRGANFAASGLWLTPEETIELWTGPARVETEMNGTTHEGAFYRERLEGYDPYMVFLNGNQPLVQIHNPEGQGSILLIRDSFASTLAGFLAQNYENVTLVDLRYYKKPVSQLAASYDRVLIEYSLDNFLTDTNIVLLK